MAKTSTRGATDEAARSADLPAARAIAAGRGDGDGPMFTIATLVTDDAQYRDMRRSFAAGGFRGDTCEYLFIDNRPNGQRDAVAGGGQTDAYRGLNALIAAARGRYIVLCHQDVRLLEDDRAALEQRLRDLEETDPAWALAGNAGGIAPGRLALRISDPHGADQAVGMLPARVESLDENFIVVRRAAGLSLSRDLAGFHFYGADIAQVARTLGWHAYVIDFHLRHLSPGRKDRSFFAAEQAFRAKWAAALAPRWVQTTCSLVRLSGARLGHVLGGLAARPVAGLVRRLARQ